MPVEAHGTKWRVRVRWRGVMSLSQTCETEHDAKQLSDTLELMHKAKGGDVLLSWLEEHVEALPNAVLLVDPTKPERIELLTIADLKGVKSKDPQILTVGQSYDDWMVFMKDGGNSLRKTPFSPNTFKGYAFIWERFFSFLTDGRHTRVAEITDDTLIAYRKSLLRKERAKPQTETRGDPAPEGASPPEPEEEESKKRRITASSANRHVMAILSWHRWLRSKERGPGLKLGRIELELPKESREAMRAIMPDDLAAIYTALRDQAARGTTPWIDIVEFLFETGLREQEALQLTLREIRSPHALAIANTVQRRLKSSEAARHVPLSPRAWEILGRYRKRNSTTPTKADKAGKAGKPLSDYVFPDNLRKTWGLQSAWRRARAKSGVEARIHDLRHTRAVLWLISERGDLDTVCSWLGHASVETTRIYTRSRANYELATGSRKPRRRPRAKPRPSRR